jgi:hypothetical protein
VITAAVDPVSVSIAGYAAVVATASVVFQIFSWRRNTQTRIEVKLGPRELITPGALATPPERVILIDMVNHSGHEVAVTHLGFKPQTPGGDHLWIPRPLPTSQPLPIVILPRRSVAVWVTPDALEDHVNMTEPIQARISTDDGKSFDSKQVILAS